MSSTLSSVESWVGGGAVWALVCTIKEIAETLEIPLGTAKTVLYRALKKLRKEWKGESVYEL